MARTGVKQKNTHNSGVGVIRICRHVFVWQEKGRHRFGSSVIRKGRSFFICHESSRKRQVLFEPYSKRCFWLSREFKKTIDTGLVRTCFVRQILFCYARQYKKMFGFGSNVIRKGRYVYGWHGSPQKGRHKFSLRDRQRVDIGLGFTRKSKNRYILTNTRVNEVDMLFVCKNVKSQDIGTLKSWVPFLGCTPVHRDAVCVFLISRNKATVLAALSQNVTYQPEENQLQFNRRGNLVLLFLFSFLYT